MKNEIQEIWNLIDEAEKLYGEDSEHLSEIVSDMNRVCDDLKHIRATLVLTMRCDCDNTIPDHKAE